MGLIRPAPLWRRFAAAIYDGLLLIGLWMAAALVDLLVRDGLGLARDPRVLQLLLMLLGLLFFGWSWTHGGQTLGMRAWQLRVRRHDGAPLLWPIAALRYVVMLLTWSASLLPALLRIPGVATRMHADATMFGALAFNGIALVLILLDPMRRAPCDLVSRTEVALLPKP